MVLDRWLESLVVAAATGMDVPPFVVKAYIAVVLVGLICGSVGSLVVGNRMAFFSDALAHCAFAGITLGFLMKLLLWPGAGDAVNEWMVRLVMVGFGAGVALMIAFVREQTNLTSDTVIGIFFAGAIGFGALMFGALKRRAVLDPDTFLFGSPHMVSYSNLVQLALLSLLTVGVLLARYNQLVFISFNPSLARSRRIPLRLYNYAFVVLLALIVNLCLSAVGVLLINAMLVVPAATASNLSRNMRQMFWLTVAVSLATSVAGVWLSNNVELPIGGGEPLELGAAGTIVVLSVLAFFASMAWPGLRERWLKRRPAAPETG
jgi:zinc transport system permease protein